MYHQVKSEEYHQVKSEEYHQLKEEYHVKGDQVKSDV
jgi:hypothetical protein